MRRDEAAVPISMRLFGSFELCASGRPLPPLRFRKSQWILALLALRHRCEVEREWLAGVLWPDSAPRAALHNLRNCLYDLRRALGPEAGRLRSPTFRTLCLDLTGAAVDLLAFDAALARGDAEGLEEAVSLYRGPLLEGCAEEWAFQERRVREHAYLAAREELANQAISQGKEADAERHLRIVSAIDPAREKAQRALMELLAAGGNDAAALQVYRELRRHLRCEMNAEPDHETQALFQQLRARVRQRPAPPPVAQPLNAEGNDAAARHNVPLQLTSFIGRQTEMTELRQQLAAHRLVTLTGEGGCGKTRLAIEAASELLPAFPDGAWFAALAVLADLNLVPQTVAAALGIREQPDRPLIRTLVEALKPQQLLLVLDNCEQLVAACADLAEALLQACPHLHILATSREPLGIGGERTYRVPPLSLPATVESLELRAESPDNIKGAASSDLSTLAQSEAVRLFVDRAATAQPAFVLTVENARAVAHICRRLDGIPLALELAAARLKALPIDALKERLDDMFGVLTTGGRTALPRHRTLRSLIDWSYDLLTPEEKTLFRSLSVFAGGCSLQAVEVVCGEESGAVVLVVSQGQIDG